LADTLLEATMSKLATILVTAAVCLPLGALLHRDAAAERRVNAFLDAAVIEDHPRLARARGALHAALAEIEASQRAGEMLWSDRTGRAAATKTAVERAVRTMDGTADWLRNGMARNGSRPLRSPSGRP
jgi:hypothetical protein